MGEGHQVWAISASFLDCSKTQDSRVYGQKHLENWDFFFFFLSKIGIVTFLKNFSKAKRIHMNDGKGHQVWAISIASFLDCSKTQDSRVYGQKHLENWGFFFFFLSKLVLLFSKVLAKPKEFIWMMETEHHHAFRTPSGIMLLESYFLLLKAICISYRNSNIFT